MPDGLTNAREELERTQADFADAVAQASKSDLDTAIPALERVVQTSERLGKACGKWLTLQAPQVAAFDQLDPIPPHLAAASHARNAAAAMALYRQETYAYRDLHRDILAALGQFDPAKAVELQGQAGAIADRMNEANEKGRAEYEACLAILAAMDAEDTGDDTAG